MFASSPSDQQRLHADEALQVIKETANLGCTAYYLTGGEPFISDAFYPALKAIFKHADTKAVILSNLSLIKVHMHQLAEFPKERIIFQTGIDGIGRTHDSLRGNGSFQKLISNVRILKETGYEIILSMAVNKTNAAEMEKIIDFALEYDIHTIHYQWLFKKGFADQSLFISPEHIFPFLKKAAIKAEQNGITINNIDVLQSQLFSLADTKFDLNNAGWESLAVGPNGNIYPSPSLIFNEDYNCGHLTQGIQSIWKNNPLLNTCRYASLIFDEKYSKNPFKFFIGGGDPDYSIIYSGKITGGDPYVPLYNLICQWLISREADKFKAALQAGFKLKIGDQVDSAPAAAGKCHFMRNNFPVPNHLLRKDHAMLPGQIPPELQQAYQIINPIPYPAEVVSHIPESLKIVNYGSGSPVILANLKPGDTVLNLCCRTGLECFIAAALTGKPGWVIGVDMNEQMLRKANDSMESVSTKLGYKNIEFKSAFFEHLPIDDKRIDTVIANNIINFSLNKRTLFSEIFRVLKPGGKVVLSDITFENTVPEPIIPDRKFSAKCPAQLLSYQDLSGLLYDLGFSEVKILKGYNYQSIDQFPWYAITYQAIKPYENQEIKIISEDSLKNFISHESSQAKAVYSADHPTQPASDSTLDDITNKTCIICGQDFQFLQEAVQAVCLFCESKYSLKYYCSQGHHICPTCQSQDMVSVISHICLHTTRKNAIDLFTQINEHPKIKNRPELYTAMLPLVLLSARRNLGQAVSPEQITQAQEWGKAIGADFFNHMAGIGPIIGIAAGLSILFAVNANAEISKKKIQSCAQHILNRINSFESDLNVIEEHRLALQIALDMLQHDQTI
jgi:MoaA/NifB/PqqE/SkfB family radical SAM enzyme/ubiquinone/menaquinone biosynthesis C-methylase UbiE